VRFLLPFTRTHELTVLVVYRLASCAS
jgi:hypothetical protein